MRLLSNELELTQGSIVTSIRVHHLLIVSHWVITNLILRSMPEYIKTHHEVETTSSVEME